MRWSRWRGLVGKWPELDAFLPARRAPSSVNDSRGYTSFSPRVVVDLQVNGGWRSAGRFYWERCCSGMGDQLLGQSEVERLGPGCVGAEVAGVAARPGATAAIRTEAIRSAACAADLIAADGWLS